MLRDTQQHLTLREIGTLVGLSHSGVQFRLRHAGIKSSDGERAMVYCNYCNKEMNRTRGRIKSNLKHYCCQDHYYANLSMDNKYIPWRHGSNIARSIVAIHFQLEKDHIVHHKDVRTMY